ncbi:MAG TPA: deoxyribodipyrimidine photo-lyase [Methylococcaceae bacterium]|nr:deoxyribodipyrimidine photo-lyase [Methylococcaceae bacterium]
MTTAIVWFRRDLRLSDNPALTEALLTCERVVPLYVHAPEEDGRWAPSSASRWWLHHSLRALDDSLRKRGSCLIIRRGPSLETLRAIVGQTGAERIYWNRLYEPELIARDTETKRALRSDGLIVESSNSALLHEPWTIKPYKVFTPYWKAVQRLDLQQAPLPAPESLPPLPARFETLPVATLGLLPTIPWDSGLKENWRAGENAAQRRLRNFIASALAGYAEKRDRPDYAGTSRLSPHLHFGEIGPRQIVHAIRIHTNAHESPIGILKNAESYLRELVWREFAHQLLYHFPQTTEYPLDERFARFPWATDCTEALTAWRKGMTGFPIVDAGMRELWHSGWMHNRVRMMVASFLTKNLRISWLEGARWFWDTLVDADLANNTLGWQWTAGCGADAAPYFRIFNPVLQGKRFDPNGDYVRRWIPELARLPASHIHSPWQAPSASNSHFESLSRRCRASGRSG